MDVQPFNRRDFLKLALLFGAAGSGLPALLNSLSRRQTAPAHANQPNFIIVVFDALSAVNMSTYDYRRRTTPNIDRFANRATVYHRHFAGGNFTVPGTSTILTGVLPWTHRGLHLFGTVSDQFTDRNLFSALAKDYTIETYTENSLVMDLFNQFQHYINRLEPPRDLALLSQQTADHLFDRDYWIALWGERIVRGSGVKTPGSLFLSYTGLSSDFAPYTPKVLMDKYGKAFPKGLPNHSMGIFFRLGVVIDWIQQQAKTLPKPFMGYYHLIPPHEPYLPRQDFLGLFNDGWNPPPKPRLHFSQNWSHDYLVRQRHDYDQYLAYADSAFGNLYDGLEKAGVLEDTYLILTADHGQLFERGIHGHLTETLYQPVIHTPLIISMPGQKQRQDITINTSAADLLPSLARAAGLPIPDWSEGQILPGFDGAPNDPERSLYVVEAKKNAKYAPILHGTTGLIKGRYKLVHYFGYEKPDAYEMYDLMDDPDEMHDLSQSGSTFDRKTLQDLADEMNTKLGQMNEALVG